MPAIQIIGGPEVLTVRDVDAPKPARGARLLAVSAAGVNLADTQPVENSYLAKVHLPFVPGLEAVGVTPQGQRVVALISNARTDGRCRPISVW